MNPLELVLEYHGLSWLCSLCSDFRSWLHRRIPVHLRATTILGCASLPRLAGEKPLGEPVFNRIGMASRGGPICRVRRATQPVDATPSSQLIRQHFLRGEPLCPAVLDRTLARMLFRLNQRSRTTLSDWSPASEAGPSLASTH